MNTAPPTAQTETPDLPPVEIDKDDIDQYCESFSTRTGSIARYCSCGKTFYDPSTPNWFEEGELAGYEADKNAFAVDYNPGGVYVMGSEFCNACDCWHPKAQRIVNFLREHKSHIAEFFKIEKANLLAEAQRTPVL